MTSPEDSFGIFDQADYDTAVINTHCFSEASPTHFHFMKNGRQERQRFAVLSVY